MKKLIFLSFLGLLMFSGCSKEQQVNDNAPAEFQWEKTFMSVVDDVFVNLESDDSFIRKASLKTTYQRSTNNSIHLHGSYAHSNILTVDVSATENFGGTYGGATFTFTDGINTGSLFMNTDCLTIEGNTSVFAGTVVEIDPILLELSPFNIGTQFFLKLYDNGEGVNAPSDQFYGIILFYIGGSPFDCDTITELPIFNLPNVINEVGNNSVNMQSPYKIKIN